MLSFLCRPLIRNSTAIASCQKAGLFNLKYPDISQALPALQEDAHLKCSKLLSEALSVSRKRNLVTILDEMSNTLCIVGDMSDCLRQLHPDAKIRLLAEKCCFNINVLVEKFNTNEPLYQEFRRVTMACSDVQPLDDVDNRVSDLLLRDFNLSGMHLSDTSGKAKFVELLEQSFSFCSSFAERCRRSSDIAVMTKPSVPWLSDSYFLNEEAVKRAHNYASFYAFNQAQEDDLKSLVSIRHQIAQITGFTTYADRANLGTICQNAANIEHFLKQLKDQLFEAASKDAKFGMSLLSSSSLPVWEVPYVTSLAHEALGWNLNEPCEFFSLLNCISGISYVCNTWFDVELKIVTPLLGEVWAVDVLKVSVDRKSTQQVLGTVYLDLFERPGKPNHDCHYTIQGGKLLESGEYQNPIVVLHFNFASSARSFENVLLSVQSVENFWHEWGHALHSMLGRTRYQHVMGTRATTDFAEIPSTLMEIAAFHPAILEIYAREKGSGQTIGNCRMLKLLAAIRSFKALELLQQTNYAIIDQSLYGINQPLNSTSSIDVMHEVFSDNSCFLSLPHKDINWLHRFEHLTNYGAKYYSYLLSNSISSAIWNKLFEADPLSQASGQTFERKLLSKGGEIDAATLVSDILEQGSLNLDDLVKSFVLSLEQQQDFSQKLYQLTKS